MAPMMLRTSVQPGELGRLPIAIMGPISQRSRSKGVAVKVFELIGAAKNIDRPSRLDGFSGEM